MAAKQGLTAQLSQAGEDAKRAVLSRTGVTSSWFSNLNTVCTIKSAPPRSPEVLQLLASKSGWLYKRNEQHVWQARWCCVVPHTFLYYFDANIVPTPPLHTPTTGQQDEWNKAVQQGYGNRKQHEKRSGLYLFNQANGNNTSPDPPPPSVLPADDNDKYSTLQPAGIIDLECYSSVHRSNVDQHVLELAGDDTVNPDLRAFYFCAHNDADLEEWTDALLNGRHSALTDECDAYKQVCDGFAQQLQYLHCELDNSKVTAEESQEELYRVRSLQEDARRNCWRLMEDHFARTNDGFPTSTATQRYDFKKNLDTIRSQDLGVNDGVRLLLNYVTAVEEDVVRLHQQNQSLDSRLQATDQSDRARVEVLQKELEELKTAYATEKKQWEGEVQAAVASYQTTQKELQDVQKDLSSTRMEITMYQSQQRNKVNELQQHKKILKKEVIELRSKLEDALSELTSHKHQQENLQLRADQERQKSELLERYVEKVESQVKVQQNMMEMMSQAGSVHGGGSVYGRSANSRNIIYVPRAPSADEEDVDDDDDDDDEVAERLVPIVSESDNIMDRSNRRNLADELDNKSHVSELTEDRTQRHFEAIHGSFSPYQELSSQSRASRTRRSPKASGPPSFIGVDSDKPGRSIRKTLNTIHSSTSSLPPGPTPRSSRNSIPRNSSASSVNSEGQRKLSVAQKARLEADQQANAVRARLDDKAEKKMKSKLKGGKDSGSITGGETQSRSSQNSGIWKRMGAAVMGSARDDDDDQSDSDEHFDNSNESDDSTDEGQSRRSSRNTKPVEKSATSRQPTVKYEEKKMTDSLSGLSLQERCALQRAKQIQFLKEQGLIKGETDIKGGAGAKTANSNDSGSVASTSASYTTPVQAGGRH